MTTRKQDHTRPADHRLPKPILAVRGEFGDGLAELVDNRVAPIAKHAHEPVLVLRVELHRHADPAVADPVTASANVDFNGRRIHATANARTAAHAIDLVVDRVTRQMDDRPHTHRRRR